MKHNLFLATLFALLGFLYQELSFAESEMKPPVSGSEMRPPISKETEGGFCEACEMKRAGQLQKTNVAADQIENKARSQARAGQDPEALKARIERAKARMLKKIRNRSCPQPQDGDDEMDMDDMMASDDDDTDKRPRGRAGMDMSAMSSSRTTDPMKIIALDEEALEEVEDAMEEKIEKCRKKNQKKANQRSSLTAQGNAMGSVNPLASMYSLNSQMNPMMAMGSMNPMMGMNSMSGMTSMMGTNSMLGMNSMNPSMMMYSPYMNTMMGSSLGRMNSLMYPGYTMPTNFGITNTVYRPTTTGLGW